MKQNKFTKCVAIILSIFILFTMSYFLIFEATHLNHRQHCHNDHCTVCYELQLAEQIVNEAFTGFLTLVVVGLLLQFSNAKANRSWSLILEQNPIRNKVRINR